MAKYAHQFTIKRENEVLKDAEHPYVKLSIESIQEAMKRLNGYEFELYLLLYMNQEGFELDYSPGNLEKEYMGTRKTWGDARKALTAKGYLEEIGKSHLKFIERPWEKEEESTQVEEDAVLTKYDF